jgi:hypothetical protein
MSNSFGARWFDMDWNAQFDTEAWANTLNFYVGMMNESGPAGYATNGFNENLNLFNQGLCGMWIDATVAASFVTNPDDSVVADSVGFALAPDNGLGKRSNWLWAWALAIPAGTQQQDAALQFIEWATSTDYIELVAENEGWANVPPGARTSLYENPDYAAVPFAQMTLDSILSADPNNSDGRGKPLCGHPVRGHPGVCGHRDRSEPGVLRSLCRSADRRRSAGERSGDHQRSNGSRGLPLRRAFVTFRKAASGRRLPHPPFSNQTQSVLTTGPLRPNGEDLRHGDPALPNSRPHHDGPRRLPASGLDAGAPVDDAVVLVRGNICRFAAATWALGRVRKLRPASSSSARSGQPFTTTLIIVGGVLLITVIFGIFLAMLLDQPMWGQGIVRILVIAPFFVMPTVSALVWKNMFMDPTNGVFAHLWRAFGADPVVWLSDVPLAVDHPDRVLAVAALRHADPADGVPVARQRAAGGRRDGRRKPRCAFLVHHAAASEPRDHHRDPDPDDLPAGDLRRDLRDHRRRLRHPHAHLPDLPARAGKPERRPGLGRRRLRHHSRQHRCALPDAHRRQEPGR